MKATLLAVDPGFRSTGWIAVRSRSDQPSFAAAGLIRTQRSTRRVLVAADDWRCCQELAAQLLSAIDACTPAVLAVETPAGSKSARAVACMARAYAICATVADLCQLPTVLIAAPDAKLAAAGSRTASKAAVAAAVAHLLPPHELERYPAGQHEHLTDAAALVLAAWDRDVVRMARRAAC